LISWIMRVVWEKGVELMGRPRKYPVEVRERAVRLACESERGVTLVARDLGLYPETLRGWVRQAEADDGSRRDLRDELRPMRRMRRRCGTWRASRRSSRGLTFFVREVDPR